MILGPKLEIDLKFDLDLTLINILSLGAQIGCLMVLLVWGGESSGRMSFVIFLGTLIAI